MAEREVQVEFYGITPQGNDPWELAKAYAELRAIDQADRYMTVDTRDLCLYPPASGDNRGQLCWVRFSEHPPIDNAGQLDDLALPDGAGLADETHFVVFDDQFVGVIRSLHGPGISRLVEYVTTKLPSADMPVASIDSLVSPQAAKKLTGATELKKVTLRIKRSSIDQMNALEPTFKQAFEGGAAIDLDATDVEITISTRRKGGLSNTLLANLRRLARKSDFTDITEAFKVRVRAEDGDMETLNLLDERLTAKVKVDVIAQGKRLDPESAYRSIRGAYENLKDDLESAAAVSAS